MNADDLELRPLATHADYSACVALQRATWGAQFRELVPPAMLMIAQKMGGVLAGAFAGEHMAGFVFGVTGPMRGCLAHWSHMLAVETAWRDRGVGRRLKEHQRDCLRHRGISHMYWTYDPLVARNAHLNLNRLCASISEYKREMYGDDPNSAIDAVIGSDRFVVEWEIEEEQAGTREGGHAEGRTQGPIIEPGTDALPDVPTVRVAIPADIHDLKQHDPDAARAWRATTRRALEHYMSHGYEVRGLEQAPEGDRSMYVVTRAR